MPDNPDWIDIGLRLGCCFFACLIIGLDREWQERAAGMRTTILVGLASCIAFISANLLLSLGSDIHGDGVRADVLRLPLGILTGMGFIGAGAIVRRGDGLVQGVTTAATLWFVTVMGLCFGAGQLKLGGAAFAICLATLWLLKLLERHLQKHREAQLTLSLGREGPSEERVRAILKEGGTKIRHAFVRYEPASDRREYRFTLWCRAEPGTLPAFIATLRDMPGIDQLDWES